MIQKYSDEFVIHPIEMVYSSFLLTRNIKNGQTSFQLNVHNEPKLLMLTSKEYGMKIYF